MIWVFTGFLTVLIVDGITLQHFPAVGKCKQGRHGDEQIVEMIVFIFPCCECTVWMRMPHEQPYLEAAKEESQCFDGFVCLKSLKKTNVTVRLDMN